MTLFKRNRLRLFLILVAGSLSVMTTARANQSLDHKTYLRGLYHDTYACLDYFTAPATNFPYDVSTKKAETSISNIGLYMAATAVAGKTGLLSDQQALSRLNKTFAALRRIPTWEGFPVTWVNVENAQLAYGPKFSYADHIGNLICGLLVVAGLYPEDFARKVNAFITPMNFKATFDPRVNMIKGGYDFEKKTFDVKQSWGNWYYNLLASDTRQFGLLGMARGQIPEVYWRTLTRHNNFNDPLDKEMLTLLGPGREPYYWPGMEGGGLFMQYLPGIFLMEKNTAMGISAKTMAYAQIKLARAQHTYPFWGISASETPDGRGYLGWGTLKKSVVTPHASMLAVADFPEDTVKCLRALEKKNMRPVVSIDGRDYHFGFTDAYDTTAQTSSEHYLALDQSMAFLSLANYLYDEIVRKAFQTPPLGHKAQTLLEKLEP